MKRWDLGSPHQLLLQWLTALDSLQPAFPFSKAHSETALASGVSPTSSLSQRASRRFYCHPFDCLACSWSAACSWPRRRPCRGEARRGCKAQGAPSMLPAKDNMQDTTTPSFLPTLHRDLCSSGMGMGNGNWGSSFARGNSGRESCKSWVSRGWAGGPSLEAFAGPGSNPSPQADCLSSWVRPHPATWPLRKTVVLS